MLVPKLKGKKKRTSLGKKGGAAKRAIRVKI
jgi:hypothetical protein